MMDTIDLDFTLNSERITRTGIHGDMMLVDFLREELGLTGTKFCCGIAVCRVCTVSLARIPGALQVAIRSCTTPLRDINGQFVTTVEGLEDDNGLHPLQQAFLDNFSFQCGYCCPGFLMGSYALLDRLKRQPIPRDAVDAAIEDAVGQHVCRCTGYVRYHRAIKQVLLDTPGLVT
jgi:aerobic-type carbon monoxide dehydrogenase small subunit (CoxS/CutS family)